MLSLRNTLCNTFLSLGKSKFLTYIIFLPRGALSTFLGKWDCYQWFPSVFLYLRKYLSFIFQSNLLHLELKVEKKGEKKKKEFKVGAFSFNTLYISLHPLLLACFRMRSACFLQVTLCFFVFCFSFLWLLSTLIFCSLNGNMTKYLRVVFLFLLFKFILLVSSEFPGSAVWCLSLILESSWPLLLQIFLLLHFLLHFWSPNYMYVCILWDIISQFLCSVFFFFNFISFSLCISM